MELPDVGEEQLQDGGEEPVPWIRYTKDSQPLPLDSPVHSLQPGGSMARKALKELEKAELQSVKGKWSGIQRQAGYYKPTDQSRREKADASAPTDLQISSYGKDYGAEVLRIEAQGPTSEILIPTPTAGTEGARERIAPSRVRGEHFANQQKGFFAYAASSDVLPQLPIQAPENKPHQMITVERTDPEKMRKLYELIPNWDSWFKGMFYWALKLTNRALVEELEGGHFVEWHQEQLIKRASLVDEVLALLYGDVLDNEQYMEICTEPGKMRKLYELVPNWDTERKDRLYQALKETNRALINKLEVPLSPEEHFVKRHREQLIQRVSSVDKVLGLLRGDVLNYKQYQSISSERSDLERMWKLFELVPSWDTLHKDRLYQALTRTNRALIEVRK
ncbi:unnamed protein product [Caretta caretta]